MFYYSLNLLIMQNSNAEHRTCTASQYTQLREKHNMQYKSKYINSHSAKQNWKGKKNCYHYHSSSQGSLSPFWFQFVDNLLFLHRKRFLSQATPCVPHCENQNHYCHTDYQLHKSCDSQTRYTLFCSNSYQIYFTRVLLTFRFVIASMRSMVFKCVDNVLCFSLSSRTSLLWKHSVLF